jgi:hypothetical protein
MGQLFLSLLEEESSIGCDIYAYAREYGDPEEKQRNLSIIVEESRS